MTPSHVSSALRGHTTRQEQEALPDHWLADQVGDFPWHQVPAISARCWRWALGLSLPMWATLIVLGAWLWSAVK